MKKIILVAIVLLLSVASNAYCLSSGKITLRVVDEQGKSIDGATAYISYSKPNESGTGVADLLKKGITGKEGLFTAKSSTMNSVGLSAEKDGYYHSSIHYEFTSRSMLNRWEPWNPTIEVVLKKERNPVPMYRKGGIIQIPKFDESIGYDLEKGDWVLPYGSGMISDFIFTYHAEIRSYRDYECSFVMTFSNEKDGIQEYYFEKSDKSYYKWPFEAPENGYDEKIARFEIKSPGKLQTDAKDNTNYIFRVRTKTDRDGNIVEAKYGKISGEFGFDPKGNMQFSYYFNPDGTRNLEEDSDKNLFKK